MVSLNVLSLIFLLQAFKSLLVFSISSHSKAYLFWSMYPKSCDSMM